MKLILIKIGKAISTIRKNGLMEGGKRIWEYLFVFLKLLFGAKEGDILFITGGVGDSAHYRSHNVAEELGLRGFKCSIMIQDNPFLPRYADKFKVFIFQKVIYTPTIARLIEKIKKRQKEIIFEADDLVFNEKCFQQTDYWKQMDKFTRRQYAGGQGAEILNDPYVKVCTTTTDYLKKKLEEYSKKVFIVPNKICNTELEIAQNIVSQMSDVKCQMSVIRIGYFSGTISHNKDFATITGALMRIMEKYKNVKLVLVGPLDTESRLNKFKDRIEKLPMVSRKKHYQNVAGVDINLAPLVINDPFCESKSELKFFEAGILGVPTVASATGTFRQAISNGVDGFLASSEDEWFEKLEKLVVTGELRKKIAQKAREKSLKFYTNQNSVNSDYYGYLRNCLDKTSEK